MDDKLLDALAHVQALSESLNGFIQQNIALRTEIVKLKYSAEKVDDAESRV